MILGKHTYQAINLKWLIVKLAAKKCEFDGIYHGA